MPTIKKNIEDADSAYSTANYETAIELYKQALTRNPKNKHAQECLQNAEKLKTLTEQADSAYYVAEYNKALQFYKQILELHPDNKYVLEQIRKAERSRPSETTGTEAITIPSEAIQLYKRARSFITMGNLTQAKKLLIEAIDVADTSGVVFSKAQSLLGNIQNALIAEGYKARAYDAIDAKLWLKAETEFDSALKLDPADETIETLLSHLRSLLKAQGIISQLEAGIVSGKKRSEMIDEVRTIIDNTSGAITLSTIFQDVVRLFGEYNNQNAVYRNRHKILQWVSLFALSTSIILLITFWSLYLYPRHRGVEVTCDDIAPGLQAKLDYPYYVANGDHHTIEITFINAGTSNIDNRFVQVQIQGTANLKYLNSDDTNEFELENLNPGKQKPEEIPFYVDGSRSQIRGPWFINFSLVKCNPRDFHIAMAAIPGLQNIINGLWATFTAGLLGLFSDQIKDFFEGIKKYFKGNGS